MKLYDAHKINDRWIIISSLLINALYLIFPLATIQVYDKVIPNKTYDTLWSLLAIVTLAITVEALIRNNRAKLLGYRKSCLEIGNTSRLITSQKPYDQLARAYEKSEYEHNKFEKFYLEILSVVFYASVILYISYYFAYLFLILIALSMLIIRSLSYTKVNNGSDYDSSEFLKQVKKYNTSSLVTHSFLKSKLLSIFLKKAHKDSFMINKENNLGLLANIAGVSVIISCLLFGSFLVTLEYISIGMLIAVSIITGRMVPSYKSILLFSCKKIKQPKSHETQHLQTKKATRVKSALYFKDLSIHDKRVNLKVMPKETVLLEGVNKSDLRKAYELLFTKNTDHIYINQLHSNSLSNHQISSIIQNLSSELEFIGHTLQDNLNPKESNLQSYKELSKLFSLEEDIAKLPDGYNTSIFDSHISKDLKYRILMTRSLIQQPEILILQHVDQLISEKSLSKLLQYLKKIKGKITIIIQSDNAQISEISEKVIIIKNNMPAKKFNKKSVVNLELARENIQ